MDISLKWTISRNRHSQFKAISIKLMITLCYFWTVEKCSEGETKSTYSFNFKSFCLNIFTAKWSYKSVVYKSKNRHMNATLYSVKKETSDLYCHHYWMSFLPSFIPEDRYIEISIGLVLLFAQQCLFGWLTTFDRCTCDKSTARPFVLDFYVFWLCSNEPHTARKILL